MNWLAGVLEGSMSADTSLKVLAAALAGIPLLFGGFGSLVAGVVASRLIARTGRVTRVRRAFGFVGLAGAAALLMASYYIRDPLLAMLSMGLASFFNDMTMPGSWATCMDVGGKFAGTVSGSMNMMGNFGGMAGPLVVGLHPGSHQPATGTWRSRCPPSSTSSGALCWLFIDPVTPLEQAEKD